MREGFLSLMKRVFRRFNNRFRRNIFLALGGLLLLALGVWFWSYKRNAAAVGIERLTVKASTDNVATVQTAMPGHQEVSRQIEIPASLEAFEQTTLYAKTAGYLKWIKVDIGDAVRKGEVIAEIDVPEMAPEYQGSEAEIERAKANIGNVEAELERAKAELELKKLTYERLKSIREQEPDVMPQQQVDEAKAQFEVARALVSVAESKIKVAQSEVAKAEAAKARLGTLMEYTKIRVPFDGVVIKRHADPGALIQQASSQMNVLPVVTIARINILKVFIDINEAEVPFVKKGNRMALTVEALPGKIFEGKATRYTVVLDPKTRTMRTEIDIPNRGGELRPGMFGSVKLAQQRKENALVVPASALVLENGKSFVYTVADGKAKRIEVKTGFDDGIRVEITEGLIGNEPMIISGKNSIKDGSPVKVSDK